MSHNGTPETCPLLRARRAAQAVNGDAPTEQTVRRLRRDPLDELARRRRDFGADHIRAGREFRWVYEAVCGALMPRATTLDRVGSGGGHAAPWGDVLVEAHHDRYLPWAKQLGHGVGVVVDVVWEGMTCREVDRARRWRDGTAAALVTEALGLYAELAGWARRGKGRAA